MIRDESLRNMVECAKQQQFQYKADRGRGRPKKPTTTVKDGRIYVTSNKEAAPCENVRITPEAAEIIDGLELLTGQTRRFLASQLIIQGASLIRFFPAECANCPELDGCAENNPYVCDKCREE